MNDSPNPIPPIPADAPEAARLAEAARQVERDLQVDKALDEVWGEKWLAHCEADRAARHARNVQRAKAAAAARWKNGKGAETRPCRIYAEDLAILRRFVFPWMGRPVGPAEAVHRLLAASRGLLWTVDAGGYVHPVGPLRDACRQPPPSAPAQ